MNKMRVLELLPFFALIGIAAIVASATLASAGFAFPDLIGQWSFGQPAAPASGSTTTATNAYMPVQDMISAPAGFNIPSFDGFGMFRSPVTSTQKYTRTYDTPNGPQTQVVEQSFDGTTGERTKTVTNL
jgi:hypothetical protein